MKKVLLQGEGANSTKNLGYVMQRLEHKLFHQGYDVKLIEDWLFDQDEEFIIVPINRFTIGISYRENVTNLHVAKTLSEIEKEFSIISIRLKPFHSFSVFDEGIRELCSQALRTYKDFRHGN